MRKTRFFPLIFILSSLIPTQAQQVPSQAKLLENFSFRAIGPSVTGGRIVDVEAHPDVPGLILVASASGGLWKSINNATTWTPIFDNQGTISLGDVAISMSNPDVIWVGTGEHNNQRSGLFGDGVYKSEDGGKTWENMGLKDSLRIGRIVIHPKDPNTVYVASSGPLYKAGGERGVYKTTDSGKSWQLILKGENDTTGFIDIAMDPNNPNVLYAAAYDRLRRAWFIRDYGPGSALYKTTDAGKTWKKLEGGFPTGDRIGRIGVEVAKSNSNIVYAVVDNMTPRAGYECYRSNDAGKTWQKVNVSRLSGSYYYGQVRIDPINPEIVYVLGVQLHKSEDGGKNFRTIAREVHVDHHGLWIHPKNPNYIILGNDGGLALSYDAGNTWDFVNNLPIIQFYAIGADMDIPYNIMGGTQDNGTWKGPSRTRSRSGVANHHWYNILGGDGFYACSDPEEPWIVYTESQFGGIARVDTRTRQSVSIRPRESGLRFNWMSPILISPHNSRIIYFCAQKVFMSLNRGDTWTSISPDLSTGDEEKIRGNVPHCTITTIDESPKQAGVIWVGTDDGNVWLTKDGGANWTLMNDRMPGKPENWWISRVIASNHNAGTAYATITGYREDDFRPFVYKTSDFGETWTRIDSGLPNEPVAVIREDYKNPNLLIIGTELSCQISLDGGTTWTKMGKGIPTIAVHDIVIHPRDGDLILGTHGRGMFISYIEPLRQLSNEILQKDLHLFSPVTTLAYNFISDMFDAFAGSRRYTAPNPPFGATLSYYLRTSSASDPNIQILDVLGNVVAEMRGSRNEGINFVQWDLMARDTSGRRALANAGTYLVKLTAGEITETTTLKVIDWQR